ncbi:MAG: hypothetical protein ACI9U2_001191 [Bradymonadia bacterium]|jgi:hypothetical protein
MFVSRGTNRRRNRRQAQRGSALVIAVLILFAMLGLGMLAMRSTTQNMAGSGSLRMNKQARFVAEVGLYHAMTLMKSEGDNLLTLRVPHPDSVLEVESTGTINVRTEPYPAGNVRASEDRPVPPLLNGEGADPAALGQLAGGLVPSYRVVVEGFTQVQNSQIAGQEIGLGAGENNEGFCMMHFTAIGYIATAELPTPEQLQTVDAEERFAEHRVKAAVPLRVANRNLCRQL